MTDAVLSNLISAASGILGAIVGGGFTVLAAIKTVKKTSQDLESAEIRRQKVECLVSLTGLRFAINNDARVLDEDKSKFMYEMNKIPSLWADDGRVMTNLRDFHAEQNNDRLFLLLRNMAQTTKISLGNLSDADLRTIALIPLSGRANSQSGK